MGPCMHVARNLVLLSSVYFFVSMLALVCINPSVFPRYPFGFRVVGVANGLWAGRFGTRIPLGYEIFVFS